MYKRRETREIRIGKVKIGAGNPIAVQSMCNTKTKDVNSTVKQILKLEDAGCEIIRVGVPDMESAKALRQIKEKIHIPLVADIHFDYKLALESAKHADKLRINPGNIGSEEKVKAVVEAAKEYDIPIRIGVNSGSIEKELLKKYGVSAKAMVESALKEINILEKNGFYNIALSLKATDAPTTIEAYRMISEKTDYPLHIGVTEAGTSYSGTIKSAIGIGTLLAEGIGDTIRVSLTENPVEEVKAAYEILKALSLRDRGRMIISCPTCSRTEVDLIKIAKKVEKKTEQIKTPIKIAVMGCTVNGPGEAREADIGVAFSRRIGILFKKGKTTDRGKEKDIIEKLLTEVKNYD